MAIPSQVTSLASAVSSLLAKESPNDNTYMWMVKDSIEKAVKVGTAVSANTGTAADEVPTNADLPNFGTAASADLTTSATDNTVGNVLKVGDFGVGQTTSLFSEDLDNVITQGVYGIESVTVSNRPTGELGTVTVFNSAVPPNIKVTQVFKALSGKSYERTNSGSGWAAWSEAYSTGNTASQAEAEAGTINDKPMTPLRTKQAFLSFTANQETLSFGSTTTVDFDLGSNFSVTLTGNTTLAFSNIGANVGKSGLISLRQDSTGGRNVTLASECKTPLGGATITQVTTPDSISTLTYYVLSSTEILITYIGDFA